MSRFLFRTVLLSLLLYTAPVEAVAQDDLPDEMKFGRNIFLPSVEVGYLFNRAEELGGGLLLKTSIEARWRNNNDVFLRLNYDNSDAEYAVEPSGNNAAVEGKTRFSDGLGGFGYRFGDSKVRMFVLAQAGVRFYSYPVFQQTSTGLRFRDTRGRSLVSRATLGLEYYLDEKTAITFEGLQAQVWDAEDFWEERGGAWGFSVGVIASMF